MPISHSQDTVGPHGRTVADAAAVLGAIASVAPDPRDPATRTAEPRHVFSDYTQFLDPNGLQGVRIGVPRAGVTDNIAEEVDVAFTEALRRWQMPGATIVDPADIPTQAEINAANEEMTVLFYEFKRDLNAYLATRSNVALDREAFADARGAHRVQPGARGCGAQVVRAADLRDRAVGSVRPGGVRGLARPAARRQGGTDGIDAVLATARPRCPGLADGLAGVAHRPGQRRPLHLRDVGAGRDRGLPDRAGADGVHVRAADGISFTRVPSASRR